MSDIMNRIIEIKEENYKHRSKEYRIITKFIDKLITDHDLKELVYYE